MALLWSACTNADEKFVFSGSTLNSPTFSGLLLTPYGRLFDTTKHIKSLIADRPAQSDVIVYDFDADQLNVYPSVTPYQLITTHPDLNRHLVSDFSLYSSTHYSYTSDLSMAEFNATGALLHVGTPNYANRIRPWPWFDPDGDLIHRKEDNCPDIANPDQTNSDTDAQGNACDTDDDNDGLSDIEEMTIYGTSSIDADTDADGITDFDEVADGTDPLDEYDPAGPPSSILRLLLPLLLDKEN